MPTKNKTKLKSYYPYSIGAVTVVLQLDLQLPVQSVPITISMPWCIR